tara:strand:+ start:860 stop:1405 length:546 start_codon:yes stop_codon:yes gene_type:complete
MSDVSLREQVKAQHNKAEGAKFAQLLVSGNISRYEYALYLSNIYLIYRTLEQSVSKANFDFDLTPLYRTDLIAYDLQELNEGGLPTMQSTIEYVSYLKRLFGVEPEKLLAHVYVRHFGDLFGGQIVRTKVPGDGKMYKFKEREQLIKSTRKLLQPSLGPEANIGFQYAIDLFEDLADELHL